MWMTILTLVLSTTVCMCQGEENALANKNRCEPYLPKKSNYFIQEYNMTESGIFIGVDIHLSKRTFPEVTPGYQDLLGGNLVPRAYRAAIVLKETKRFEPARKMEGVTFLYNFLYGDTATCHHFNPDTGEYKTTEIGFHSRNFFCVLPMGRVGIINFHQHNKERFALIGVTPIRRRNSNGHMDIYTKNEMMQMFPQHHATIENLYPKN